MITSARGYGRSLDLLTLLVLLRHQLEADEIQSFDTRFDRDQGFTAWFGPHMPDDLKWFETLDSAWLALHIGQDAVPGARDE